MLDFLASLASSVTDAVKLALKAVLRLFGPGPSTDAGRPGSVVIKSVPGDYERSAPTEPAAKEAPAPPPPPPASAAPEPEEPFSPAPASPPASAVPEPEEPFSPAPASPPASAGPEDGVELEGVDDVELEGMASAEPPASPPQPGDGLESAAPAAEPEPEPRPVLLGGSAPRRARPGDVILAQFTAYVEGFEEKAREELTVEGPSNQVRLGVETDCRWPVGTRVTARCSVRGFTMEPLTETFVWDGECRTVQFDIQVPADAQPRSAVILMEAFVHDRGDAPDAVQVGRLRMPLEIGDVADDEPPQRVDVETPRTAFASYASEDRLDVLERVSSIRRSAGLEVWMDVVDLRMGDEWNPALDEHILASDRFLLFWSENSAKSRWVTWERERAVEAHGEDVLELHLLRFTPIDQVPEELRKYHFNDVYIMARDAELYRREQAARAAAANTPAAGG